MTCAHARVLSQAQIGDLAFGVELRECKERERERNRVFCVAKSISHFSMSVATIHLAPCLLPLPCIVTQYSNFYASLVRFLFFFPQQPQLSLARRDSASGAHPSFNILRISLFGAGWCVKRVECRIHNGLHIGSHRFELQKRVFTFLRMCYARAGVAGLVTRFGRYILFFPFLQTSFYRDPALISKL